MCPEDRCNKKVVDENNGTYRCEKCNKTYPNFKWSYMISVRFKYYFFQDMYVFMYVSRLKSLMQLVHNG